MCNSPNGRHIVFSFITFYNGLGKLDKRRHEDDEPAIMKTKKRMQDEEMKR